MIQGIISFTVILWLVLGARKQTKRANAMQQFVAGKELEHQLEMLQLKKQLSVANTQSLELTCNMAEITVKLNQANETLDVYRERLEQRRETLELLQQTANDATNALSRAKAAVSAALKQIDTPDEQIAEIIRIIDNEPV